LFIVEGESAGGSAKQARDRKTQAILPLKGKILNVEKARFDKMLSSQEVATLITALGCGIGPEEYDPAKVRYHNIIIMTDADVDGSHIRTLLLTFFFRQMPELIERGYIYIAQPPLFKVKKGKQEIYVKDEKILDTLLLQSALEGTELHFGDGSKIAGAELEKIATEYHTCMATIQRISRRYPKDFLEALMYTKVLTESEFSQHDVLEKLGKSLETKLNEKGLAGEHYAITVVQNAERPSLLFSIDVTSHGVMHNVAVSRDLFTSNDYQQLTQFGDKLNSLIKPGAYIQRDTKKLAVDSFNQAMQWLINEAKKGQTIQRYKGLGEMNADQLRETTMDPTKRRMLQVRVEDAVAADQIFTTLMGDEVEPRRQFIEANALDVANLDV
jgi:DNA gyrase subunit B